jgi:uncharacterized membrane protein YdbT with pleckstrin-like domain
MSYVDRVLQPGEEIRYRASIHWITYLPGLALLLVSGILWILAPEAGFAHTLVQLLAALAAAGGAILLVRAWFNWWITEIAVTNRRIIYKTGFIRRETNEMHMDKVESVRVDQSILGRIFDYGDVNVLGTGEGFEPLKKVDAPIELRNHITGV